MSVKFSNNAVTTLTDAPSIGAIFFNVADASAFPTLASGDWTYVSLTSEVVKVTAIVGNKFTCDATSNAHSSGESVELRMTSELLNDFAEDTEALPLAGGTMTGDVSLGDNVKAKFGAGDDLQIYHDSGNSVIRDQGVGNLYIMGESSIRLTNNGATNHYAKFNHGGSVDLYHNNASKLSTTSTGIDVTGTAVTDGLISSNATGVTLIQAVGVDTNGFADVEIKSTGTSGSSRLYFSDTAGQSGSIKYAHSSDAMLFSTAGTSRLNIANNGDISFYEDTGTTPKFFWDASAENLGIGTISPASKLDVVGGSSDSVVGTLTLKNDSTGASAGVGLNFVVDGVNDIITSAIYGQRTGSAYHQGSLQFLTRDNTGGGLLERMRITSAGNVGIGTTSPSSGNSGSTLDVTGPILARGFLATHKTNAGVVEYNANVMRLRAYGATAGTGAIAFNTGGGGASNDTERMRITSTGNVGIGTSSPNVNLEVGTSAGGTIAIGTNHAPGSTAAPLYTTLKFQGYSNNINAQIQSWDTASSDSARSLTISTRNATNVLTERMRIDGTGKVTIGGVVLGQSGFYSEIPVSSTGTPFGSPVGGGPDSVKLLTVGVPSEKQTNAIKVGGGNTGANNSSSWISSAYTGSYASDLSLWAPREGNYAYGDTDATRVVRFRESSTLFSGQDTAGATYETLSLTKNTTLFKAGNAEVMRLNSSGNVGIGTSGPTAKLEVRDYVANSLSLPISVKGNGYITGSSTGIGFTTDGSPSYTKGALVYTSNGSGWNKGHFQFLQNTASNSTKVTLADAVMTIQNGGNVGIGTTAPTEKLDVTGNIKVSEDISLSSNAYIRDIPSAIPRLDFGTSIWGDYYTPGRQTSGTIMVGSVNSDAAYSYHALIHWSFGGSNSDAILVEEKIGAPKFAWQLVDANLSTARIQVKDTYGYSTQIKGLVTFVKA